MLNLDIKGWCWTKSCNQLVLQILPHCVSIIPPGAGFCPSTSINTQTALWIRCDLYTLHKIHDGHLRPNWDPRKALRIIGPTTRPKACAICCMDMTSLIVTKIKDCITASKPNKICPETTLFQAICWNTATFFLLHPHPFAQLRILYFHQLLKRRLWLPREWLVWTHSRAFKANLQEAS